jgi:hypothetical protein
MCTIQNHITLCYHSSFPWTSNFLHSTYIYIYPSLSPIHSLLLLCITCTFQVALLMSLILVHCLGRFHSVWLFWGHNRGFLTVSFLWWQVVGLLPNPHPGGPVHFSYNPWGRAAQLYPQALRIHFSCLLQPAWAAVGLFCSLVTTQRLLPN